MTPEQKDEVAQTMHWLEQQEKLREKTRKQFDEET